MDASLLLRASDLPGVLDGWCGPALKDVGAAGRPEDLHPFAFDWRPAEGPGPFIDMSRFIWLDTFRPEVADRIARVVAARFADRPGFRAGACRPGGHSLAAPEWSYHSAWGVGGWCLGNWFDNSAVLFHSDALRNGFWGPRRRVHVPALAGITDPARALAFPAGKRLMSVWNYFSRSFRTPEQHWSYLASLVRARAESGQAASDDQFEMWIAEQIRRIPPVLQVVSSRAKE